MEIDATWQVTDNLQLTGTLFAANPEFKNDFIDGTGELAIRAGMRMPNSPERTAHASLYYEIPTPMFGGNGWIYYDVSYGSETWVNSSTIVENDLTGRAPSWVLHGLSAGLYWQNNLELDITVRNLFDQQGYNYIERFQNSGAEAFGDPRFRNLRPYDRPRTVWLTVRKGFGG